jgi:hypothetical protein
MTRFSLNRSAKVKLATLAAVAASFGTVATPVALAFNPQPDPPGRSAPQLVIKPVTPPIGVNCREYGCM